MELQRLKEIYARYIQEVDRVYAGAKPMDGLFGFGDDPRKDPCHMRFYEDAEQWTKAFADGGPGEAEVFEAVRFMLEMPARYAGHKGFWFLYAAQGLTRALIPLLRSDHCALLRELYDEHYPRRDRMPVQKDVYALLKKGAKNV